MTNFFEATIFAALMAVEEYYEERKNDVFRISNWKKKNLAEIVDIMIELFDVLIKEVDERQSVYISKNIIDGLAQLPLLAFLLVIQYQKTNLSNEQRKIIQLYFTTISVPYTETDFLSAAYYKNGNYNDIKLLLGADKGRLGAFWMDIIDMSKKTTKYDRDIVSIVVNSLTKIMVRFAAIGKCTEDETKKKIKDFSEILVYYSKSAADKKKETTALRNSYVDTYQKFENEFNYIVKSTKADQEGLQADILYPYFCMGIVYSVVKESALNENTKVEMLDFVMSDCNMNFDYTGRQIIDGMEFMAEDIKTEELGYFIDKMISLESNSNFWLLMATLSGKSMTLGHDSKLVEYCIDFLLELEGVLLNKYPYCQLEGVAKLYVEQNLENIDLTINRIE